MECLAIGMELPATGRIVEAGPDSPYIGVTIEFDLAIMRECWRISRRPQHFRPIQVGACS
ncbi:AraC family transcriptional regulator N-terminal domain-containing protein [Bradyrhizobium sp. 191]|uniref:AraC family transcriptional regulator N-terminal domain-containing protein n=1 Tax=Bradyrhizobium sp. 191 TaxID=2782659 RepID=UPI00320B1DF8